MKNWWDNCFRNLKKPKKKQWADEMFSRWQSFELHGEVAYEREVVAQILDRLLNYLKKLGIKMRRVVQYGDVQTPSTENTKLQPDLVLSIDGTELWISEHKPQKKGPTTLEDLTPLAKECSFNLDFKSNTIEGKESAEFNLVSVLGTLITNKSFLLYGGQKKRDGTKIFQNLLVLNLTSVAQVRLLDTTLLHMALYMKSYADAFEKIVDYKPGQSETDDTDSNVDEKQEGNSDKGEDRDKGKKRRKQPRKSTKTQKKKTGGTDESSLPILLAQTRHSKVMIVEHPKYGVCVSKESISKPELLQKEYEALEHLKQVKGVVRVLGHDDCDIGSGETLYLAYIQKSNWVPKCLKHFKLLAKELFTILAECHAIGVVHGDLSRNNVLVELQEDTHSIKIIDFNFSVKVGSLGQPFWCVGGTPGFCAPEVKRNQPVTSVIDIWSAGITLLSFITKDKTDTNFGRILQLLHDGNTCLLQQPFACDAVVKFLLYILEENPKKRPCASQVLHSSFLASHSDKENQDPVLHLPKL